ncbi:type VII secretion-associated serine protease mycosin [Sinosporangium album]|uniref:Type VII secretion-associated serine protease mycosin n=1 Tax=Sinosporangium album TaxID=504805 RepID=A0A1G7Y9X8_9ACTN|nr:S8 family serine peptidase [Sinosporangium album]SDG92780.1 type VII secretion-associated serine protease mycosin [Sinosporangium album]
MLRAVRRRVVALALGTAAALAVPSAFLAPPAQAFEDGVRGGQAKVLDTLDLPEAWRVTKGEGVVVAVLDSGVDPVHRDLQGSVIVGKDFTEGANPPNVPPRRLHGTYMASLIAGHGHGLGGEDGVIGVAPESRVLSVRVILEDEEPGFRAFNSDPRFEDVVAKGIRYAVDQGADVINMSISKELATEKERAAIGYAVSKGVVLVAAAGNDGAPAPGGTGFAPYSYPAAFPGVVSVAAADHGLRRASFSNWNPSVLLAAPGVDILGAGPGDEYWVGKGTSQATALVSGVVALIKAEHPNLPPALVIQALTAGAIKRPTGGYDTDLGFGVVNAARSLAEAARLARYTFVADGSHAHDPARVLGAGKGAKRNASGGTAGNAGEGMGGGTGGGTGEGTAGNAGGNTERGAAGSARQGRATPPPVEVVRRDSSRITIYGGVAVVAGIAALVSVGVIALLVGRARRVTPEPVTFLISAQPGSGE